MNITPLLPHEITYIQSLQPADWNDITITFSKLIHCDFFYAVKMKDAGRIIGVGEVILFGSTGWLGHIIVAEEFRNQGIGTYITRHLMDYLNSKKVDAQLLLATAMGEKIYGALGFQKDATYLFLKREQREALNLTNLSDRHIIPFNKHYLSQLLLLDRRATGEDRSALIGQFLEGGLLYKSDEGQRIEGFYLPALGDGLIIAENETAGKVLMQQRIANGEKMITLPAANKVAISFAVDLGYYNYRQAGRMVTGRVPSWKPAMIYNRISGYAG